MNTYKLKVSALEEVTLAGGGSTAFYPEREVEVKAPDLIMAVEKAVEGKERAQVKWYGYIIYFFDERHDVRFSVMHHLEHLSATAIMEGMT